MIDSPAISSPAVAEMQDQADPQVFELLRAALPSTVRTDDHFQNWLGGVACPVCGADGFEARLPDRTNGHQPLWRLDCQTSHCRPWLALSKLAPNPTDALNHPSIVARFYDSHSPLSIALGLQAWGKAPIPMWRPSECNAGLCTVAKKHGVCSRPGKHPRVAWKKYQAGSPPMDYEIRRWWGEWPEANIAVITGRDYDLVAVDCDDAEAMDWAMAHGAVSPRGTVTGVKDFETGWRGRHFLFRYGDPPTSIGLGAKLEVEDTREPESSTNRRRCLNLDVRADAGLATWAGSEHHTGVIYELGGQWEGIEGGGSPFDALPLFPHALFGDQLDPAKKMASLGESEELQPLDPATLDAYSRLARRYIHRMGPAIAGKGGDTHTFRVACQLVNDFALPEDRCLALLVEWNAGCVPPWSDGELREKLESASRYAKGERGNKRRRLVGAAANTEEETASSLASDLPEIDARDGSLPRLEDACWTAIKLANAAQPTPCYFRFSGLVADVGADDHGVFRVRPMSAVRVRSALGRVARWFEWTGTKKEGRTKSDARPPLEIASALHADPDPPLPLLHRITEFPFAAPGGKLVTQPGYDQSSRAYYSPAAGFECPAVPPVPTPEHVQSALSLIFDELLHDFPFTGPAEKAHALALLLLPFARDLIDGPTPLHDIEAPTRGTGKGLLATALLAPALGREPQSSQGVGRNDTEEWKKQLAAILMPAPSVVLFDNLEGELRAGPLASALTQNTWSTRILGESRDAVFRIRCVWVVTANNLQVAGDFDRRIVRIRLDAKTAKPETRTGFKHQLPNWAYENRPRLVQAALTLIQNWLARGSPPGGKTLGSYQDWARVMGGILEACGVSGFLENREEAAAVSNPKERAWIAFLAMWWEALKQPIGGETNPAGVSTLLPHADEAGIDLGDKTEKSRSTRLGVLLAGSRDRCFQIDLAEPGQPPCPMSVTVKLCGAVKKAAQYQLVGVPVVAPVASHGEPR